MCPGVHLTSRSMFLCLLITICKMKEIPEVVPQSWLDWMMADVLSTPTGTIPHTWCSSLINSNPRIIPTPSPSYTVWCFIDPSLIFLLHFTIPSQYSTGAAPSCPSNPDPSIYTFTHALSSLSSFFASSLLSAIHSARFGSHFGSWQTAAIFSISSSFNLKVCIISCKGVWCLHMTQGARKNTIQKNILKIS